MLVASIYAPNGNPNPGPKFAYKLAWLERLTAHAAELLAAGVPVVLAGDYNVVPTEADIYQPNSWKGDALVDPAARAAFAALVAQGWTDALLATPHPSRAPHPHRRVRGRGTTRSVVEGAQGKRRMPAVEGAQGRRRTIRQRRRQRRALDLLVVPAPPLGDTTRACASTTSSSAPPSPSA